jgi:hypothetical protein
MGCQYTVCLWWMDLELMQLYWLPYFEGVGLSVVYLCVMAMHGKSLAGWNMGRVYICKCVLKCSCMACPHL